MVSGYITAQNAVLVLEFVLRINHTTEEQLLNYTFTRGFYLAFVYIGIIIKVMDSPAQGNLLSLQK